MSAIYSVLGNLILSRNKQVFHKEQLLLLLLLLLYIYIHIYFASVYKNHSEVQDMLNARLRRHKHYYEMGV
jgi:putative lipase involved disintegration of autophagic bodies